MMLWRLDASLVQRPLLAISADGFALAVVKDKVVEHLIDIRDCELEERRERRKKEREEKQREEEKRKEKEETEKENEAKEPSSEAVTSASSTTAVTSATSSTEQVAWLWDCYH